MKKSLLVIIAVVSIAAIFILKQSDVFTESEPQRAKIDKAFVCYFNIEQLAQKGVLDRHITYEQRRLAATMASANIHDSEVAAHTKATIEDLTTSGIDITKPVYGYYDTNCEAMVFVAEVASVDNLDKTVGIFTYLAEQEDGTHISKEQIEEDRYLYLNDAILCYNATRAAFVIADDDKAKSAAAEALSSLLLDLELFGDTDIAMYLDVNTAIGFIEEEMSGEELPADTFVKLRENFTEDAYFVSSITFDPGRAILHSYFEGINESVYNPTNKSVTLNHLNYINDDLLAAMGGAIDGLKTAELIEASLDSEVMASLDNETNMVIAIALDALETINGDVTLALQSLEGEYKEYIDYYWGDVAYRPIVSNVSGALMADVTDTYIISNVGQFTSGVLRKAGDNHYVGELGDYNVSLIQRDNLLFAGLNTAMEEAKAPASKARWIKDIEGSVAYMVIDVDNLMKSSFVEAVSNVWVENMDYPQLYTQLTNMLSYAYLTIYSNGSSDIVFVMDDASTNSLEQLNDVLLPVVVGEFVKSIM